jgi:hypothetical protein
MISRVVKIGAFSEQLVLMCGDCGEQSSIFELLDFMIELYPHDFYCILQLNHFLWGAFESNKVESHRVNLIFLPLPISH